MSTKNKTEDKLIESMRKNKTVAEKAKDESNDEKKDEKAEASAAKKQQTTSVKKSSDKSGFMTSRRVWPD